MSGRRNSRWRSQVISLALIACCAVVPIDHALAWGDEDHRIIALVAERFLDPAVRGKTTAMLAADLTI